MNDKLSVRQYAEACSIGVREAYRHREKNICAIPGHWLEGAKPASFLRSTDTGSSESDGADNTTDREQQYKIIPPADVSDDDGGIEIISLADLQDEIQDEYNSDDNTADPGGSADDDDLSVHNSVKRTAYLADLVKAANLDEEITEVAERAGIDDYEIPGGRVTIVAVAALAYGLPKLLSYLNQRKAVKRQNYSAETDGGSNREGTPSDNTGQQSTGTLKVVNGVPTYE